MYMEEMYENMTVEEFFNTPGKVKCPYVILEGDPLIPIPNIVKDHTVNAYNLNTGRCETIDFKYSFLGNNYIANGYDIRNTELYEKIKNKKIYRVSNTTITTVFLNFSVTSDIQVIFVSYI